MVVRAKTINQITDLAFSGFKSVWRYIGGLHTRGCLQDDNGVAADGTTQKNSRPGQYEHDEDGRQ